METTTAAERMEAARTALQHAEGKGWADPFAAGLGLQETLTHLEALVMVDAPSPQLAAELAAFSRQLQRAAAAHQEAASVHEGLLRTFEAGLDLNPGASYGSDGVAPAVLSTPGLRLVVEG